MDASGGARRQCAVLGQYCARDQAQAAASGLQITSNCQPSDSVACYFEYVRGFTPRYVCWGSPGDCETMNGRSASLNGRENVSACRVLDVSFQTPPPGA